MVDYESGERKITPSSRFPILRGMELAEARLEAIVKISKTIEQGKKNLKALNRASMYGGRVSDRSYSKK
tara:strand:- start:22034 stop:22240 length:207 start_codon:yes stop_codon:yes gene_type:complete